MSFHYNNHQTISVRKLGWIHKLNLRGCLKDFWGINHLEYEMLRCICYTKKVYCASHTVWLKSDLWKKERNNTTLGLNISQNLKLLCVSNCYLSHQAAACEDLRKEPLCYKRQQRTIWLDEWVSSLCADKVPCNKKGIIKFRGTLLWIWQVVPTLGREQGRLVRSICLWIGSSKKSEGKMVDKLTGKEAWGPLLAANLAEHSSSGEKHICVSMWSFLPLYMT